MTNSNDTIRILIPLKVKYEAATSDDARENAELKGAAIADKIDAEHADSSSETVLSIMPRWRANKKQGTATWKKHTQYIREFADVVGDLPLPTITKKYVIQFVEHAQALRHPDGREYSPNSVAKRLDSVKALLAFAVEVDEIDVSPASGVKAPKDHRPRAARSWKSFEPAEVSKLVTVATEFWANRKIRVPGRNDDLLTALHCLVWTGARPEEISQLRREDVDVARAVISITNDNSDDDARERLTKNEQSVRDVPIHSRLLPFVEAHLQRHNHNATETAFEATVA